MPGSIVSDNGTEVTCRAVVKWVQNTGMDRHNVAPGKPTRNVFNASFSGKLRLLGSRYTFYVGALRGIGRIYQQTNVDACCQIT